MIVSFLNSPKATQKNEPSESKYNSKLYSLKEHSEKLIAKKVNQNILNRVAKQSW